jgi:hypothetical protein
MAFHAEEQAQGLRLVDVVIDDQHLLRAHRGSRDEIGRGV